MNKASRILVSIAVADGSYSFYSTIRAAVRSLSGGTNKNWTREMRSQEVQIGQVLHGHGRTAFGREWLWVEESSGERIAAAIERAKLVRSLEQIDWRTVPDKGLYHIEQAARAAGILRNNTANGGKSDEDH